MGSKGDTLRRFEYMGDGLADDSHGKYADAEQALAIIAELEGQIMGKCKDCAEWTTSTTKSDELWARDYDGQNVDNWGMCASESGRMKPSYDGGYRGELLTRADFGCTEFRGK